MGYTNTVFKNSEVFIGVGLKPDMCGRGLGTEILSLACEKALEQYPGVKICLQVREWNTRAIKCYEKAGFEIAGEAFAMVTPSGEGLFYKMKYNKN